MKRTVVFSFLITFLTLLSFFSSAQASEQQIVTLDVPGMTCNFCPITIRKALEKVPGVSKAEVSYETKTAIVTFNPVTTNAEALTKATANAGYPSTLKVTKE